MSLQEIAIWLGEDSFHVFDNKSFQITKYIFGSNLLLRQLDVLPLIVFAVCHVLIYYDQLTVC